MLKLTESPILAFLSMRGRESWRFDFFIDLKINLSKRSN